MQVELGSSLYGFSNLYYRAVMTLQCHPWALHYKAVANYKLTNARTHICVGGRRENERLIYDYEFFQYFQDKK